MSGEKNLSVLLTTMSPELSSDTYVFCTFNKEIRKQLKVTAQMEFVEKEGTTLILLRNEAVKAEIEFSFPSKMITLNIHSDLEAVGFLAAITNKLAAEGISVNAVSAFYHDHLFVPCDKAERAMELLVELSQS